MKDIFKNIKKDMVTIKCGRQVEKMRRDKAVKFYYEGMMCCDGSESERYATIFCQLVDGCKFATDEL